MSSIHNTLINPNVVVSTINSYTGTIGAGATWNSAGLGESVINYDALQVYLVCDEPCTIYVDQGSDGISEWGIIDSYTRTANQNTARTFASVAPYYRIRIKNNSPTTPANVILLSAMSPTMSVLPRALAEQGGLRTTMDQYIEADTNNSSTADILAGATFTGTAKSTLGVAGIQVTIKTNQNCTIYVDQSPDGTNWDITDTYNYYYIFGGDGWTIQSQSSYVRVRVKNLNASVSATNVRLQTALCPIVEALPRSLSAEGNLKVGVYEIENDLGYKVGISPMGDMRVEGHTRLVGSSFGETLDTNFWTTPTIVGTGAATVTNGVVTLTTGTGGASGNSVIVQSVRSARYIGGYPNYYRGQIQCPTIVGSNIRRWGAFGTTDGFFFQYDGSLLSVVCRKGSSDVNKIDSGSFNGKLGNIYTLDTSVHTYEIYWTNKSVCFEIDGVDIHVFTGSADVLSNTLSLPVGLQSTNSGVQANANNLLSRSSTIHRMGPLQTQNIYKNITTGTTTVCKYSQGRLNKIILNNTDTTAGNITIYDNTSAAGTLIGTLRIPAVGNQHSAFPTTVHYDCPFFNGLTIVTSAATDITVIYE